MDTNNTQLVRNRLWTILALAIAVGVSTTVLAIGGRGGGRGGGGRMGGVGGMGGRGGYGGGARPMPSYRPSPRPMSGAQYRPSPRPVTRPSYRPPSIPSQRPGGSFPTSPGPRPGGGTYTPRPGGGTIAPRPGGGTIAPRPGGEFNMPRPSSLPDTVNIGSRPGTMRPGGSSVPNFGGSTSPFPSTRPGGNFAQRVPGGRPTQLPARVNPGQLGDFLGMEGVRPGPQRPSWQNMSGNQLNNIHNNFNVAAGNRANNLGNWVQNHPDRGDYWRNWGQGIGDRWNHATTLPAFDRSWWSNHHINHGWWHYSYLNRPWGYWWSAPAWTSVASWVYPQESVTGYYYDYGTGGNVVYNDNRVLVDGQDVGSSDEFAQSAADLATVEPPATDEEAAAADWLPLGTFALSTSPHDDNLTRIIQLAVNKQGIISGTMYHTKTEKTYTLQGKVDKKTQRVAMMVVDRPDTVLETGLYNLTQDQVPMIIHHGNGQTDQAILVRLKQPEDSNSGDATQS